MIVYMLEVLRRYSNRGYLTKSVQDVLRRIEEGDQTDEPGVDTSHDVAEKQLRRKGPGGAEREELIEKSRSGVSVRALAEAHPGRIAAGTQERIAELGYTRAVKSATTAAHHRRGGFATWVFQPAATGRFPAKAPRPERPAPILSDAWPGVPVRGRGGMDRGTACWVAIAPDLTPHGLPHTYKTMMIELGTPGVLMDAQLGHQDGSIAGRYSHVTADMTARLLDGLIARWGPHWRSAGGSPGSPVRVLDRLLRENGQDRLPGISQGVE